MALWYNMRQNTCNKEGICWQIVFAIFWIYISYKHKIWLKETISRDFYISLVSFIINYLLVATQKRLFSHTLSMQYLDEIKQPLPLIEIKVGLRSFQWHTSISINLISLENIPSYKKYTCYILSKLKNLDQGKMIVLLFLKWKDIVIMSKLYIFQQP